MKLLVAAPTFGTRSIRECVEGELVWVPDPCPTSLRNPEGPCSCASTFTGLETDGLTTTAMVRDFPELSPDLFRLKFWAAHAVRLDCTCSLRTEMVDEHIQMARHLPAGTVVERRLSRLIPRSPASG